MHQRIKIQLLCIKYVILGFDGLRILNSVPEREKYFRPGGWLGGAGS